MNILLINPHSKVFTYRVPPLGILYMAFVLRANGFSNTFVLDAAAEQINLNRLRCILYRVNPAIIGITAIAFTYRKALETLKLVKKTIPKAFTVIGGIHPYNLPESCIKEDVCDCVVVGEGEITLLELCAALEGGKRLSEIKGIVFKKNGRPIMTSPRELITNLDNIPFPSFDLINVNRYTVSLHHSLITSAKPEELILPIIGSRGCFYRCVFCCNDIWNNRIRMRSAENILSEIKYLIKH